MDLNYKGKIDVQNLDKFWVNGEEFSGITYQGLLSVNTKTYVEEPVRANDGSMPNIEDYDTFFAPQVKFSLKYFSISDYQRICRIVNSSNQFPVKYWDKQFGEFKEYMMYMKPEQMTKLYNVKTCVFGVLDYELEFVGTLNNLVEYEVKYLPKWWNGTQLVDLEEKQIPYSESTTYSKGQIVYWNGEYYEAVYYENSFSGQQPPNTTYWQKVNDILWNSTASYKKGDVVYDNTIEGKIYYEAKKDNFSGYSLNNTDYWGQIDVDDYNSTKTYINGEYCLSNDVIYKAIYYKDTFSNKSPDQTDYWTKVYPKIGTIEYVKWGNSTKIITSDEISKFYIIPNNKNFVKWNTLADCSGFSVKPNTNFTIFEDTTLYPIFGDI